MYCNTGYTCFQQLFVEFDQKANINVTDPTHLVLNVSMSLPLMFFEHFIFMSYDREVHSINLIKSISSTYVPVRASISSAI